MPKIASIPEMVALHVEDAAFLWHRRRLEINGPTLGDDDMGRIDQRLDANIEGLLASGLAGWEAAMHQFSDYQEAGEVFVLGTLALRWNNPDALDAALDATQDAGNEGIIGFSGAIARCPAENLRGIVGKWLNSADRTLQYFGLCALSHHRVDPKQDLLEFLADRNQRIRIRAQRLAGELGRCDALPLLARGLEAKTAKERIVAATATCLLGEPQSALPVLEKLVDDEALGQKAMEMWLLASPRDTAERWLLEQLEKPERMVAATSCLGLLGERRLMPWLIRAMRDPPTALAAGAALWDLFEIDFDDTDLFSSEPELFSNEFADLLEDESPPVADLVAAWWEQTHDEGQPVFRSMRRQRLEALRTCMTNPGMPLGNWQKTRRFPCWM